MKGLGVAVAGGVLAAGLAGRAAFAAPHPRVIRDHPNSSPAHIRHCRNLGSQLSDLAGKEQAATGLRQKDAIQRHIDRLRQQFVNQRT